MKLFALHLPNGRLILGAGLYGGTLVVWTGTRPHTLTLAPSRAARVAPHRGADCRW